MRIIMLIIFAGFLYGAPAAAFDQLVMPELEELKSFYQNADEIADSIAQDSR